MSDNIETILSAWNIPPGQGHRKFANWLVNRINPNTTVDLGVDLGYSTFALAESNKGHVFGIDSFLGDDNTGPRNTYQSVLDFKANNNFNNVTIIKGFFDDIARNWISPIDILHIDGLHTYKAVSNDFAVWTKFLEPAGVVLMHDVCSFDEVKQFYNSITWPKLWFSESFGLGVTSRDAIIIEEIKKAFPNSNIGNIT